VVEESSQVSAPAIPGALFFGTCQEGKKGKGLLRGNTLNSSPSKFFSELTENETIATDRVFFPSLPGDMPGRPSPLLRLA
jgi:hypothetical protein